ncbi:MAG: peptidoglycan-binding domain-containing protein, partial [Candidatus Sungiibacteriota bacterium]
ADHQALIKQLTANVAVLQAQIDGLRQTNASSQGGALSSSVTLPANPPYSVSNSATSNSNSALNAGAFPGRTPVSNSTGGESGDEGSQAPASFDRDLYFGLRNDADVSNLQEFLTDQGFYNNTISGNFFILTKKAVQAFQKVNNLKPTGYFGPLSRAAANRILGGAGIGIPPPIGISSPIPTNTSSVGSLGVGIPPPIPTDISPRGSLSLDPLSATLTVGERVAVRAIFTPPRPACLNAIYPCEIAERAPYEVQASFISDNPNIAAVIVEKDKVCDPPRMCTVAISSYTVRGVSPGTATISATYTNGADSFAATMAIRVIGASGAPSASGSLYIEPSSAQMKVGETVSVQALFQSPCPAGMACIQSLKNVNASFAVDKPFIVVVDQQANQDVCAPPRMCPVALNNNNSATIRGLSAGDVVITASYTDSAGTYTAKMKVSVAASSPVISNDCTKEPADSRNSCWQTTAQQKGDISFCRNITASNAFFSHDGCVNAVAQIKKDSSLCVSIADVSIKQGCVSSITSGGLFPFPLPRALSTP